MVRRISVTSLLYWCSLYLEYAQEMPIETTGTADQFGSAVHELIYRMLSGDHKGLFDTEEDLAWSVLLESFPGSQVDAPLTKRVVGEILNMARAAKHFADGRDLQQFEVKFEYDFGSKDTTVVGIADALGLNELFDWKTGSYQAESHRQQVKIYATMLWRLGFLQLPATLGVVYLGDAASGGNAEAVVFPFDESEAIVVEQFVSQFLAQCSSGPAKPHVSDHCAFCPYGKWCNRTVKNVQTNDALHELWKLQERAGLLQKKIAPDFEEGIHLTEDFIVEKKGSFYLKVRRKNNGS
jgi:putative RecB family exonuclease